MIFIHIPKVAGTSLMAILSDIPYIRYAGHNRALDFDRPKFCFVRNPYDRLVSAYFYLLDDHAIAEPDISYKQLLLKYRDFKDFVMNIERDRLDKAIVHVKPMSYYICDDEGNIVVDNIFKIEEPEKIDIFLENIGVLNKLSETFERTSKHAPYKEYLDDEIKAEIERIYALDFELFNYEKE